MAQTWESRRLAHERAMYDRLEREITGLADPLTRLITRYATERDASGAAIIPDTRRTREDITRANWLEVVKPYYIGAGVNPLDGSTPQSPFMRLIVDGITGAIQIQAERQIVIVEKLASPVVRDWLTGPRPFNQRELHSQSDLRIQRELHARSAVPNGTTGAIVREQRRPARKPWYDPFHLFVNPNGYRLSDNGWRSAIEARTAIDRLLDQGIVNGTPAVELAKQLEPFLWPGARRVRTKTPYGTDGSYWARRLARTEITAAGGRSLINASLVNPYVTGIKWNLSLSHPCCDICDDYAAGGENGIYAKDALPGYPAHPHELCYLTPETASASEARAINSLWEARITARTPEAVAMRGAFNLDWLVSALVYGWIINTIFDVVDLDQFKVAA